MLRPPLASTTLKDVNFLLHQQLFIQDWYWLSKTVDRHEYMIWKRLWGIPCKPVNIIRSVLWCILYPIIASLSTQVSYLPFQTKFFPTVQPHTLGCPAILSTSKHASFEVLPGCICIKKLKSWYYNFSTVLNTEGFLTE